MDRFLFLECHLYLEEQYLTRKPGDTLNEMVVKSGIRQEEEREVAVPYNLELLALSCREAELPCSLNLVPRFES